MIRHIESRVRGSGCIFQYISSEYFSFEENAVLEIQIYQCLVEQLARKVIERLQHLPEDVHDFIQHTLDVVSSENLKTVFRMLIRQLPMVYVFFDGLDEICDNDTCWDRIKSITDFVIGLSLEHDSLRIWCSSQDRSCIKEELKSFEIIDMTTRSNKQDIERFLSSSISKLDALEDADPGTRSLVLGDLCNKADGCFLWASLMLDSITKAATLNGIQRLIRESLPKDCEKYYQKKMDSIALPQRTFIS